MAESYGISESVTVEVVRASPFQSIAPALDSSDSTGAIFAVIGLIFVLVAAFFILRWYTGRRKHNRIQNVKKPATQSARGGRILRAVGVSAAFGFLTFLFSASPLSWVLAAGIFYYEFFIRMRKSN